MIAVSKTAPGSISCFRQALYRNLWIEGKDISDTPVIFNALESCDLTTEIEADEACEAILQDWQTQWESGNFGMRTPAIQSSDGRRMVGLQNYKNIIEFFRAKPSTARRTSQHPVKRSVRQSLCSAKMPATNSGMCSPCCGTITTCCYPSPGRHLKSNWYPRNSARIWS